MFEIRGHRLLGLCGFCENWSYDLGLLEGEWYWFLGLCRLVEI